MKPQKVLREKCLDYTLGVSQSSYTERDCILYALGVGCSQDPLNDRDLRYTYENHSDGFNVLPAFATTFPNINTIFDGLQNCPGLPEFNPMMLLHGQHKLRLFRPLEPTASFMRHIGVLRDVQDKKSGALAAVNVDTVAEDGTPICQNEFSLFIRGLGNFSSPLDTVGKSPSTPRRGVTRRHTDLLGQALAEDVKTPENMALLYRLSGDTNPLHADKQLAAVAGFKRPILHGLCSFGIAAKVIVQALLDNEPSKVCSISGRFSAPVTPGDELRVQMWSGVKETTQQHANGTVFFKVVNRSAADNVCLDDGVLTYTDKHFYAKM